jgi:hypothetical protein
LGDTFLERPLNVESTFAGTLVSQATLMFHHKIDGSETRILRVIEGSDSVGGRYQLRIVRSYVRPGDYEHQMNMVHPTEFLPAWRRATLKLSELCARFRQKLG